MYRIVRVNTRNMPQKEQALYDMYTIVDAGYYWKMSEQIEIPYGTPMIAMGGHGGRGLYLFGISNGDWEQYNDGGEYHLRIPVVWQPVIYSLPPESVEEIGAMCKRWNLRFGCQATQGEFRNALHHILSFGNALNPYNYANAA